MRRCRSLVLVLPPASRPSDLEGLLATCRLARARDGGKPLRCLLLVEWVRPLMGLTGPRARRPGPSLRVGTNRAGKDRGRSC